MAALARFSRKTLTSYAMAVRGGFRSNIHVKHCSFIHGPDILDSELGPVPWHKEETVDTRGWLDKEDPDLQFDCLIHHLMFFQHRLEIPGSFIRRNGMENVSQVRLYGKAGQYFTCDLSRKLRGDYYVQGHMVAMLYKQIAIPAGTYIVFKLKVDNQFRRDGVHKLFVMKVQRRPPDGMVLSLKDLSSKSSLRHM